MRIVVADLSNGKTNITNTLSSGCVFGTSDDSIANFRNGVEFLSFGIANTDIADGKTNVNDAILY